MCFSISSAVFLLQVNIIVGLLFISISLILFNNISILFLGFFIFITLHLIFSLSISLAFICLIFLSSKYSIIHFSTSTVAVAVNRVIFIFLLRFIFSRSFIKCFIKK